ncbi:MAG: biotin/lipoyl-binding protein [Rubrivivax sp.]
MARRLGGAVLLKAAAGGGGKGIRIVHDGADDAEAAEAIAAAMREGRSAFGDPSLLVERYLPQGRHVEVQIVGDGRGKVRHLWERECSLQRRHQKVVEEAPALPLPPGLRRRLLDAAVALGRRVDYRALGTVEFLVVGDEFFFLEVNPRLQVEHPVTEAVTGLDLVELQIRAAAGELDLDALPEPRCQGHAIELRLYAEDPEHGFLPATGRVQQLRWPAAGVRVETGIEAGSVVTPHYDPLLAKLIVHGADRAEAIAQARAALAATRVAGLSHNLAFLEMLLASPAVAGAVPHTGSVDALAGCQPPRAAWRDVAAAIAAAWVFEQSRRGDAAQPVSQWPGFTHWRLSAPGPRPPLQPQYECVDADGRACKAAVGNEGTGAGALLQVQIDGGPRRHALRFSPTGLLLDGVAWPLAVGQENGRVWISDGRHTERVAVSAAASARRRAGGAAGAALTAPMTGKLLELRVREGDAVRAGQVLALLESMKMEMRLAAPHDGIVAAVGAAAGATVERGAVLLTVVQRPTSGS